jgi:hypothetical protein
MIPTGNIFKKVAYLIEEMQDGDIAIDIHLNAPGKDNDGAMCYYLGGNDGSRLQATKILNNYCFGAKQKNNGVKPDTASRFKRLGFIRDLQKPELMRNAFIIELGFISNVEDLRDVRSNAQEGFKKIFEVFILGPERKRLADQIHRLKQAMANNPSLKNKLMLTLNKITHAQEDK